MKKILLILICAIIYNNSKGQCSAPFLVYNSNVHYYNATVNWNYQNNIYNHKIRYKIVGDSVWSWKYNIDSLAILKNLNNLTPLNTYIWQIQSNCNDTGNFAPFSTLDTFYTSTSNCPTVTGLSTNNINYNEATANWMLNQGSNRYRVHYRIYGSSTWLNLAPVDSLTNSILMPVLQQNTTYEWEIMAYYDSTSVLASLWSDTETFTTSAFVASPFDPIITNSIDNTSCNAATSLTLFVSQSANQPDIGTTEITTDGGNFNIQALSTGDSIGYAIMNTATQSISATLRAGIIMSQNLAFVNSYDSIGNFIGLFEIMNTSIGVRVKSISPNDGNNYTSGFTSILHLNNIFINPNINGPLSLYTDIQSELSDQFNDTTTININCITSNLENIVSENLNFEIFDLHGRKTKFKENTILIYKYSNGIIRKIITTKK